MEKQETFDIVNENDEVIGTTSREECHNNPDIIHRGVHFTLYNKNSKRIFFSKQPMGKRKDQGMNIFLGEHVLSGEDYEHALIRGVEEELGFTPTNFKELGTKIFQDKSEKECAKFFLVYVDKEELRVDPSEVENEWWLDIKELKDFDDNVSTMTKYWIENIDWNKVL
jgi:isopentenyldiphosphate isomerase